MDFRFFTEEEIRKQRVNIDKCIKELEPFVWREGLDDPGDSNCYLTRVEVVEALKNLRAAKLWLQEALERVGRHIPEEYRDDYTVTKAVEDNVIKEIVINKQLNIIDTIKNKSAINFKTQ